mgnify:CR=1 FL=1
MKKLTTLSILLISLVFIAPIQVSAATNAGVKPGSFFYFFDTTFENVGLFFTFNPEKKARKALEHADERLAEIEAISEEKNPDAVKTAIANYESNIVLATEKSKEIKDKGQAETLLNSIADNTSKNQEVLTAILIKVPEEAREAITQAIEASKKGQEEAAKQIAELKKEVSELKQELENLKGELKDKEEKPEMGDNKKNEQTKAIDKLKNEIENLKKKPTTLPTTQTSPKPVAPQISEPTPQPVVIPDYKIQTFTILNTAKENYTKLIDFSRECISLISQRKAALQNASADRASWLSKLTFDSKLLAQQTAVYDLYDAEISSLNQYISYCETTVPNVYNANIAKINNSIFAIQSLGKPITFDQLIEYQTSYFGTNSDRVITFESVFASTPEKYVDGRTAIQSVIDRFRYFSAKNNAAYQSASDAFWAYVDKATAPSLSPPQYSLPVPSLPPMPQTTRCTISGDGVGLQAYVNCTTSSF